MPAPETEPDDTSGLPRGGSVRNVFRTRTARGLHAVADVDDAVSEQFHLNYAKLVRLARFLTDDTETAEDVVMEAFVGLYRRWASIKGPEHAYGYLRSSVINGSRSQLRRRRVTRIREIIGRPDEDAPMTELPAAGDLAQAGTDRVTVMDQLRSLPRRQREVLVLRYYEDLSEAEIADELGIGRGAVKTHSSRGLAALAHALEVTR